MAEYFVTMDGAGAADGKSLANAWSRADFQAGAKWSSTEDPNKINFGDIVWLCDEFTASLEPAGSGTSAGLIYIRGDYPDHPGIINGCTTIAHIADDWTNHSGNIWYMPYATNPYRMKIDGVEYPRAEACSNADVSKVTSEYRWFWSSGEGRLYTYSEGNPATNGCVLIRSSANYGISHVLRNYLSWAHIEVIGFQYVGRVSSGSYNQLHDLTAGDMCLNGLSVFGHAAGYESAYNMIYDNIIDSKYKFKVAWDTGLGDGVNLNSGAYTNDVYDNTITDWGHSALIIQCTATERPHGTSYNNVYRNTLSAANVDYCSGVNIVGYEAGSDKICEHNIVQYNTIRDTTVYCGIQGNNNKFIYNVIRNITNTTRSGKADVDGGIGLTAWGTSPGRVISIDNLIANNIVHTTNGPGIIFRDYSVGGDNPITHNIVCNNILMDCGLDADTETDIGMLVENTNRINTNTIANNVIYRSGITGIIKYRGAVMTVATLNGGSVESDVISGNIQADPLFVDAASGDFHLQRNSPCIDAGTDVGLTRDYAGVKVPQGWAPDIGIYERKQTLLWQVNRPLFRKVFKNIGS